jgi:hypothetical protein
VNGGEIADSATNLYVTTTITDFSPTHGPAGTPVQINGDGFTGATAVKFNGVAGTNLAVLTDNEILVKVPAGTTPGPIIVIRPTAPTTITSATNFDNEAKVTGFAPTEAKAGDQIVISGTDLNSADLVTFTGTSAASVPTSTSATSVHVLVPAATLDGPITVHTSLGNAVSADSLKIDPTIVSFSPASAGNFQTVHIYGTGFFGTVTVMVKGTGIAWNSPTVVNPGEITAVVPGIVGSGHLVVTTPNGSAESSTDLTYVPPPIVSSFTPGSGKEGVDSIVINGQNFTGATAVSFNGTAASTFTVDSDIKITVAVPVGATTGTVVVTTPYGANASSPTFTVLLAHSNGLGQTYYDASPLNTYTQTTATEAALAWNPGGTPIVATCGASAGVVYVVNAGNTQVAVWVYGVDPTRGHVFLNTSNTTPTCPMVSDPVWH